MRDELLASVKVKLKEFPFFQRIGRPKKGQMSLDLCYNSETGRVYACSGAKRLSRIISISPSAFSYVPRRGARRRHLKICDFKPGPRVHNIQTEAVQRYSIAQITSQGQGRAVEQLDHDLLGTYQLFLQTSITWPPTLEKRGKR